MLQSNWPSVQFSSGSLASDSLRPQGLQHARPPCPSPTPGVYSNSCPLSRWCHPTISSSVVPFSSCLQSFQESGFFPMSQFFASGGLSIGVSAFSPSDEYSGLISFRFPFNQFSSVAQPCSTLCDPMDWSMPGFPTLHYHLEFAQTHAHWVSDAIQPSHPLSFPSPTFNLSQHQGLFQWKDLLPQVVKGL